MEGYNTASVMANLIGKFEPRISRERHDGPNTEVTAPHLVKTCS